MDTVRTYTARKVFLTLALGFASFCLFSAITSRFLNL